MSGMGIGFLFGVVDVFFRGWVVVRVLFASFDSVTCDLAKRVYVVINSRVNIALTLRWSYFFPMTQKAITWDHFFSFRLFGILRSGENERHCSFFVGFQPRCFYRRR